MVLEVRINELNEELDTLDSEAINVDLCIGCLNDIIDESRALIHTIELREAFNDYPNLSEIKETLCSINNRAFNKKNEIQSKLLNL